MKLLIHDLTEDEAVSAIEKRDDMEVLSSGKRMARCVGCFGCWLKTPGRCVLHDGFERLGEKVASCDELILVSRNVYGGFSPEIKNFLDRSISLSLPSFTYRGGTMHHYLRYSNRPVIRVFFYPADDMTEEEKETAREIVKANGVNLGASETYTTFLNSPDELREALR